MYTMLALLLCAITFIIGGQSWDFPHFDALSPPKAEFRPLYWEALRHLLPPRLALNLPKNEEPQEISLAPQEGGPGVSAAVEPSPRVGAGKSGKFEALIRHHAQRYGLEERLVWAVIDHESGFDAGAVSSEGAKGLMQLMPRTAKLVGVKNPLDARQNIAGGVKYLRMCLEQFDQDLVLALAAFNAGPGNVEKYRGCPPFKETQRFVSSVMKKAYGRDWRKHRKMRLPQAATLVEAENGDAGAPQINLGAPQAARNARLERQTSTPPRPLSLPPRKALSRLELPPAPAWTGGERGPGPTLKRPSTYVVALERLKLTPPAF
jgi:hypothetical protein